MGPMALLPLRRKWCSGFLSPLKIHRPRSGLNQRNLGPVASTLTTSPPRTTLEEMVPSCWRSKKVDIEADVFSELLVSMQYNTRRHTPEVLNLNIHLRTQNVIWEYFVLSAEVNCKTSGFKHIYLLFKKSLFLSRGGVQLNSPANIILTCVAW
jgi:hypothetical protein